MRWLESARVSHSQLDAAEAQGSPHLPHQQRWAVQRPTAQGQASGRFRSAKQPGPCRCPPCRVLLAAEHLTPGWVSVVQMIQESPEPRRPGAWRPCPGSRPRATKRSWPFFQKTRQTSKPGGSTGEARSKPELETAKRKRIERGIRYIQVYPSISMYIHVYPRCKIHQNSGRYDIMRAVPQLRTGCQISRLCSFIAFTGDTNRCK